MSIAVGRLVETDAIVVGGIREVMRLQARVRLCLGRGTTVMDQYPRKEEKHKHQSDHPT